ncbi:MAG: indolepyruvate oxidoreductase subunit beta [Planctomycetes bacterium]|nr:indolepyruvate oxidoreductase subunit beta [Planctomycetota bacterium]MBL7007550.1 indolepyruvate oxidoreductase subunit beta [Planctomycetota bacterium]
MKYDILLAGVGGQGLLSMAVIIASAAMKNGYFVKQSEVHGMSQRGGAVLANLRISDQPIHSDIIARGDADMILSLEIMEGLRYLDYLAADGTMLTSTGRVENIGDYPAQEEIVDRIQQLPHTCLVQADDLAKEAGTVLAGNMAMVGAASVFLPLEAEGLEIQIERLFRPKGGKVVETNLRAFRLGRNSLSCAAP